jgi:hypothetical protein
MARTAQTARRSTQNTTNKRKRNSTTTQSKVRKDSKETVIIMGDAGSLDEVPQELLRLTFEFLDFYEKHEIIGVCSKWKTIVTPLAQKHHVELLEKLGNQEEWIFVEMKRGCWREPSSHQYHDEDAEEQYVSHDVHCCEVNIHNKYKLKRIDTTGIQQEEFKLFKELNDMEQIDSITDLESVLPPIKIDTEVEFDSEFDEFDGYIRDWTFVVAKRTELRELLLSINSLRTNLLQSDVSDDRSDFFFVMPDGVTWHYTVEKTKEERRYSNYNE